MHYQYQLYQICYWISERRENFVNFDLKEWNYSDGQRRQDMTTDMVLEVSSTFYIRALFTGYYDRGCGFTFNLLDEKTMYHLDFRLNNKLRYRKLIISSQYLDDSWAEELEADLPDLARVNEIFLTLTEKYYKVTINKREIPLKFSIDLKRLRNYKGIRMKHYGKCIQVDRNRSYMTNGGNESFHLKW